ncbi:UvrD-helicase domain-containing protein [Thermodesulfobacteriota bacterium]
MISYKSFIKTYIKARKFPPNKDQENIIQAGPGDSLFVVAGPGTGKTASIALRILKLIFVDGIPPQGILATTFTVKAAAELRSRVLGWGFQLLEEFSKDKSIPSVTREKLAKIDINQIITGTIDSICQQLLSEFRDPGTQPPVMADEYVSKTLLLREGLLTGGRYNDVDLDNFLLDLHGGSRWGYHIGSKNNLMKSLWERRYQDQVKWSSFLSSAPPTEGTARQVADYVLSDYHSALTTRGMVDYTLLEQEVLSRLTSGKFTEFSERIQVILVDEYQDTNLLQESIYFEFAKACKGAFTVVGDDDQSLYRFRGATVELFSDFDNRYNSHFGSHPTKIFLTTNYRSTQNIISFTNSYATLDTSYQSVRVSAKPPLAHGPTAPQGTPILGMFRDNVDDLAEDLGDFIHQIFRGSGYLLPDGNTIQRNANGDLGDCALLCSSPAEYSSGGNERLPFLVRENLRSRTPAIEVFNPRGQDMERIELVEIFGGLLLECLDPGGVIETTVSGLPQDMTNTFQRWRDQAIDFVSDPAVPPGLEDLAVGWADRDPNKLGHKWPESVPLLDLIYGLVHFFPALHDDPEGQIYLEVFTRQVSACEQIGKFSGRVVTDPSNPGLSDASVKELIRDFLGPIAGGVVSVNEDLMEAFPRDRFCIISTHQSKGLEFPLTIVDVGSDFKTNHGAHAFKRFPKKGSLPHILEDLLRPFTSLHAPSRSVTDRAFDDLYRQFFVAFSRPEQVLLLVGHTKTFPGGKVSNVATGWDRDDVCQWAGALPFIQI